MDSSRNNTANEDFVVKRNGTRETVSFDKILTRVKNIEKDKLEVNYTALCVKIIDRLYNNIPTSQIDELTAQQCASLSTTHPDYGILASRILISNHHKNTEKSFLNVIEKAYNYKDIHDEHSPIISEDLYKIVKNNHETIESWFDYERDYMLDYFGFKTLERAYLLKINGIIIERPQHMWMRVSLGIHGKDLIAAKETYDLMSRKVFTHATPTLFNAGTPRPQLSSCYLLAMESDSIKGIYNTLGDCAAISKWAGGIGLHIHNIRAKKSHIRGTNGTSNGIVPMLRVFNTTARYVDQCVEPNTLIYTTKGPMEIQYCDNETEIFTTSKNEKIENILEHSYDGEMFDISTEHSINPLRITDEHPIYCLKSQGPELSVDDIKTRLENGAIRNDWIEAKNLSIGDYSIYTIPTFSKDYDNITNNDCYMYGILTGPGVVSNKNTENFVTIKNTNTNAIEFTKNYLTSKCIEYSERESIGLTIISWKKTINLPFRHADFHNNSKEYTITSKWLNLPVEKIKHIINGVLSISDKSEKNNHIAIFKTHSRMVAEGIRYMCIRLGLLLKCTVDEFLIEKERAYYLMIPKNINNSIETQIKSTDFFTHNNLMYSKITHINTSWHTGALYDLQMTNTHNYMIHNGVVHNGGGKRAGSFAIYLEPWHSDIEEFLDMKKNHGDEEARARDLFYALWIPDLFMRRVKQNKDWTLMCPDKCPGLSDVYGEEFDKLYEKYENEGRGNKSVPARSIWFKILDSQIETGTPYMLYKDAANIKSNQKNLGTIKSSNLCCEIMEYSDDKETAVCNLASIALSKCVVDTPSPFKGKMTVYYKDDCKWCDLLKALLTRKKVEFETIKITPETFDAFKEKTGAQTLPQLFEDDTRIGGFDATLDILRSKFDYDFLHKITKIVTKNLNKVIDINFYPTPKTKNSNLKNRPIGIGVQGLADVYALMSYPFHSEEAKEINKNIFETMYHAALEASMEIAKIDGPYSTYKINGGSPISNDILQFDMWGVKPSDRWDWKTLRESIKEYGIRNSLLLAPMPTASTSQILGNNECFEPFTSNIYVRRTLAGEFIIVNKYLMGELIELGLWNEDVKNAIVANNGSIQSINGIPMHIKEKFKTVWEIPMKHILEMSADRGAFICQSQSQNLWMSEPTYDKLTAMHFFAWQKKLKTGIYYLRTRAKAAPQQFTIEPEKRNNDSSGNYYEEEECLMCGS